MISCPDRHASNPGRFFPDELVSPPVCVRYSKRVLSTYRFPNGYWTGAAWSAFAGFAAIPAFQGIGIVSVLELCH